MLMLEFAFLLQFVNKQMFKPFILPAVFAGVLLYLNFLTFGQPELLTSDPNCVQCQF
jgi:hypothetical protein